ncbi:hypothetical protein VTK26DRAFT_8079 [Humicola hyalothermophila]
MDKKHYSSLLEDHSPGPSVPALRPLSPFRNGRRSGSRDRDGGTTNLNLNQDQPALSCVTKETSQDDCARHRFIVWAAVKRNSSVRMTPQERLECPLLRCTQRFGDHEAMLKHLAGCKYLASGEYWCYDHMRVERFDDLKCKRCLGHPSRRKKILHMAKNFFHTLGHKSKKSQGIGFDDDESMLAPPPSYDSLGIPDSNGNALELPSTEILEIDSVEVPVIPPAPAPAPNDAINPQALLVPMVPPLPELDSTMLANQGFMQWPPLPVVNSTPFPVPQQADGVMRNLAAKPNLQLTTNGLPARRQASRPASRPAPVAPRGKGLSPSSSVRSTASTDTNASLTSNGSSLISRASNWSGAWSVASGLDTSLTSPVGGIVTDEMFAGALEGYSNLCPDYPHNVYSELPADCPALKDMCDPASDPLLGFEAPVPVTMPYPDIVLTEDAAESVGVEESQVEQTNPCCSETKSLVSSAWDALQEHIVSSMVKIQDHQENHLAKQLSSMSMKTIAATGLRALRALVNGRPPSSASDALCLIHLIYAFSLVLHEQEMPRRFSNLFLQSLTYANGMPTSDRNLYRQLVVSIWQPPHLTQADVSNHFAVVSNRTPAPSGDPKGKSPEAIENGSKKHGSDPLLDAGRDFLDELEISLVMGQDSLPLDVQVSDLHIKHLKDSLPTAVMNQGLLATVRSVLEILARGFSGSQALGSKLRDVYQRLGSGCICSVRRLEIEMLCAGKDLLPSTTFFDSFVPQVRGLCNQIYEHHDVGTSRRDVYHNLGITLIESLIPELDTSIGRAAGPPLDDIDALFKDLESGGDTTTGFTFMDIDAANTVPPFDNGAQLPTPTATSGGTPSSTHAVSPASEQAQQQQQQQPTPPDTSEQRQQPAATGQKVEANSCCELCGYRPKGDPQWFKGSMAKHKKLQHSTDPPKIYKCPYPGCTSQYKNRPDNLRQHQIEKNHWVQGEESTPRRPSKRKKVATEEQ